ncbi:MAG: hypothetical protein M1840_008342 [Geoglossum simile]|nr:MAG: hypothetical protein M1840_008342 [Geoglossum simile]
MSRRHSCPTLWDNTQPQTFIKTVALLQKLNATPALPAENSIGEFSARLSDQGKRSMTIEKERDLAGYLSFLIASTNNPLKVTALCVEENSDATCMTIRLAVNSGDLTQVKEGLESIAKILMQVAKEKRNPAATDSATPLLQQIVTMNRDRILSRLRFKYRTKGKPPIVPRLYGAVCGPLAPKAPKGISADELSILREYVTKLLEIYKRIEKRPEQELLLELVKCAYEISSQRSLEALLKHSALQRCERESVHKATCKLGRYYSASRFLIAAARKLSIFGRIRVETIRPPPQKPPVGDSKISINDLLDSLFSKLPSEQRQTMKTSAYAILKRRGADADATVSESLSHKYRVHAEIQLLLHYALNADANSLQPRVIYASKSACFLCNLFLKFYGQFFTPKTHGRLYEKWAVPQKDSGVPVALAHMFGGALGQIQAVLTEEIRKVLVLGRAIVNYPNESLLAPSARWSSPSRSIAGPHRNSFGSTPTGGTARNGDTRDPTANTTPGVSPLPGSESQGFSRQSSRTSVETVTVAPPERALQVPVGAAEPIAVEGRSTNVLPLLESTTGPVSGTPEPVIGPGLEALGFVSTTEQNAIVRNNIPLVPGSPQLIADAGEFAVLGATPISNASARHGLHMRPMAAIDAFLRGGASNTQTVPSASCTTLERDDTVAIANQTSLGVSPQLTRPLSPPVPLLTTHPRPADALVRWSQGESRPLLPIPLATAQPPSSPPMPPTVSQSQISPPTIGKPPTSTPTPNQPLLLYRGTRTRYTLHPSHPPLLIHTPRIHATLSSETPCSVLVKYLLLTERPRLIRLGENVVNVKQVAFGGERTAVHGGAFQGTSLYLRNREDLVEVKYEVGGDDGVGG